MKLINLTPHDVVIKDKTGKTYKTILPDSVWARVDIDTEVIGEVCGVPLVQTKYNGVYGLPEPQDGVMYIVSHIVMQACPERTDLVRPDTGPTCFRKPNGYISGVQQLTR